MSRWTGRFVAQPAAPSAERLGAGADQILLDVATGSQARTREAEGGDGWTVVQRCPLKLWNAVEDSVALWQAHGSPHLSEFGMTITADAQRVWLGAPDARAGHCPSSAASGNVRPVDDGA